jgi:hypothetical protein
MTEQTALGHKVKKRRVVKPAVWKTAQSLKPNTQLMDLLLLPNPTERVLAMRDAWKFSFPVTQATERVESDPQVIFAPEQETVPYRTSRLWRAEFEKSLGELDLG